MIENREIVFIKLPVKTVAQDARLIGTIIIAQISAAIFSFTDIPEAQRPGLSLYVDEFQHFATTDFSALFTEGRKFGIKVTLAHQYRNQLPDFLQDSTMTARTKICFQTTPEDGREMARLFPVQEATVKPEDITPEPADYLLKYGSDEPVVAEFIETYMRPMLSFKRGNKVDIQGKQWNINVGKMLWHGFHLDEQRTELFVPDPLPFLNQLLYQVMRTGNLHLPIPPDAIYGFANGGRGFFPAARGIKQEDLLPMIFPPHLVVHGRWTRDPENAREQLLHFLFCLRRLMAYLAEHPIGKKTQPNTSAVAEWLTSLPQRSAFVRSGEDVGAIYTHDTPPRITGNDLSQRLQAVQAQTRAKYCHSSGQVQQLLLAEAEPTTRPVDADGATEIAGWGEIGEP